MINPSECRQLKSGILSGIVIFIFLWISCLALSGGFSVMGVKNAEITRIVRENFLYRIIFFQIKIFLAYVFVGAITGAITGLFWATILNRLLSVTKTIFLNTASVLLLHIYFVSRAVLKYPQLFTETFYDRGGLLRKIQVFITGINPLILDAAGVILFVLFIFPVLAKFVQEFRRRGRRPGISLICFCAALFLTVAAGAGIIYIRHHRVNKGPNIIFIGSDSLRFDRLSGNGYSRKTSPNIDRLMEKSVSFDSYYISCPRTFPSFLSILTGTQPATHGIRHMFPTAEERQIKLPLLTSILKKNGYATGVVGDFAADIFSRINLDFDIVDVPYFNFPVLTEQRGLEIHFMLMPYFANDYGRRIFPGLMELSHNADPGMLWQNGKNDLNRLRNSEKFFMVFFFSVNHFPYAAPHPYYRKFTDPSYSGPFKYHKINRVDTKEDITQEDITQINALYDGTVAAFDAAVGRILEYLEKTGLSGNTIVIVSADHGDSLYEKNYGMGHGEHLRGEQVIRPPLIIYDPFRKYPVGKVKAITQSIDLMPSLLQRLELPVPETVEGKSFLPLMLGEKEKTNDYAYCETGIWFTDKGDQFFQKQRIMYPDITVLNRIDFGHNYEIVISDQYDPIVTMAKHRMIRTENYKLIYIPTHQGVKYELLRESPGGEENENFYGKYPEIEKKMKEYLWTELKREKNMIIRNDYLIPSR